MDTIAIYFQYTHFSNVELNSLRSLINTFNGKMQLVSAKQLTHYNIPITFGKLLFIRFVKQTFNIRFINEILSKFNVLRLLFIELDSFILSPALYLLYTQHKLQNIPVYNLLCLSYCLNNVRMLLFRLRYLLLSIYLLFQENLLFKSNIQYIC